MGFWHKIKFYIPWTWWCVFLIIIEHFIWQNFSKKNLNFFLFLFQQLFLLFFLFYFLFTNHFFSNKNILKYLCKSTKYTRNFLISGKLFVFRIIKVKMRESSLKKSLSNVLLPLQVRVSLIINSYGDDISYIL